MGQGEGLVGAKYKKEGYRISSSKDSKNQSKSSSSSNKYSQPYVDI